MPNPPTFAALPQPLEADFRPSPAGRRHAAPPPRLPVLPCRPDGAVDFDIPTWLRRRLAVRRALPARRGPSRLP